MSLPGFLFLLEVPGVRCDQVGQDRPEIAREQWLLPVSLACCCALLVCTTRSPRNRARQDHPSAPVSADGTQSPGKEGLWGPQAVKYLRANTVNGCLCPHSACCSECLYLYAFISSFTLVSCISWVAIRALWRERTKNTFCSGNNMCFPCRIYQLA